MAFDHVGYCSMKDVPPKECRKKETKWLKILDSWDYWIQKKPEKVIIIVVC